ncbi:TonB-dependent receptor [Brucella pseudogrignonensis]|uniref:TonB-dependent receptor n=1 Tax=Brucella pseudogrignonensis TaxID=419475 RepID=UPI0028B6304D|nr:TonB-dependent receptor [Brucella pseudogrignonensis]MDT6941432.1 TonB-dependent receptor [Brucella pseudogrignonensis]
MNIHCTRGFLYGVSALTLVAMSATTAFAQDRQKTTESKGLVLDTLVITGEKVARDIKNTASSVTVITGEEISRQKTGDNSVSEVVRGTPNVVYTDTVSAPVIRGQDTQGPHNGQNVFWGGTVPRATINMDGHYLNYNEFYYGGTSVWDINNIEVFRGPQTTSQGANAIAGTIIVNTNDPTFEREGAYQVEIGNYNSKRTSIMLNSPIYKEELAARLALDYSGRDTFIDYISPAFQTEGTDQAFKAFTGRLKLLWEPAEIPGLVAKLTYSHARSNRPSQEASSGNFEDLEHSTTSMPSWKQDTNTGILDISYDLENGFKLYNQTQFSASGVHRHTGTPTYGKADINQKNISNEARVTYGDQEDTMSGVAGIFYAHTKSDELLLLQGTTTFDDTKTNLGLFAETSYRITEQWTLTGGLRFQQDSIERVGISALTTKPLNYDETFSAVLPKISLAYAVTPELTVGAMVSKGYNPGGVSLNLSSRNWHYFEEEKLWNYELFTRANLLDDKLTLTSNVFYMDFKNAQYNIPVVLPDNLVQSYTINAEKAHAYGLELGLDYQIMDNLALKTSAGILRTKIDEITSNNSYKDNEFAKSPGYMFSVGASWDATEKLNVSGQVRHTDGYYSDIANTSTYIVDAYTIADARVSYDFHESVQLYGFVKNIFDERTPTYLQQNRGIGGLEASMTMPRTFGIGLKGSF